MINLLPPEEKESLLLERNKKLVIVLGNVIIIFLICLAMVLFSLKFYILQEVSSQKAVLDEIKKEHQTADSLSLKKSLQKYNSDLIKTDTFYRNQIYFSDFLKTVLEVERPEGLHFTNIAMEKDKENDQIIKVSISGLSDTRDNLLVFKNNVESNKEIKDPYFPPNSWIKPRNVSFILTFQIQK